MSLRGTLAPMVTLGLSLGLHALVFSVGTGGEVVLEAGGGEALASLRLGNSFQDMVAGAPDIPAPATSERVTTTPRVEPVRPDVPVPGQTPAATAQAMPVEPAASRSPLVEVAVTTPVETASTITGVAPNAKPLAGTPPVEAPGSGNSDTRAGTSAGNEAVSSQSDAAPQSKSAGNSSVASYPGLVMKKLKSTSKDRLGAKGRAVVGFVIAANGTLAEARIVTSSGNPAIDAAALAFVRRAAPFPMPPEGAERRYSIEFASA